MTELCTSPRCIPRQTDAGRLCTPHTIQLGHDARELGELYGELEAMLTAPTGRGMVKIVSTEHGIRLNDRAVNARHEIRALLMSWSMLIVEERAVQPPQDTVLAMAAFVELAAPWLAGHDAAGDASDEFAQLVNSARRAAYPSGVTVHEIGPCPSVGCAGVARAIIRPPDSRYLSELVCTVEEMHRWDSTQWLNLASR